MPTAAPDGSRAPGMRVLAGAHRAASGCGPPVGRDNTRVRTALALLAILAAPGVASAEDAASRRIVGGFRATCERAGGIFVPDGVRRDRVALGREGGTAEVIQFTGASCDRVARTPGCNTGGCRIVVRLLPGRGRRAGGRVILDGPGMDPGLYEVGSVETFAIRRHHDFCRASGGAPCFALPHAATATLRDTLLPREPRLVRAF